VKKPKGAAKRYMQNSWALQIPEAERTQHRSSGWRLALRSKRRDPAA